MVRRQDLRVTDSQDEQTLTDLLRDADQIHIPIFQRSYIWKKQQFDELAQDIRLIREGVEDSQFLGAIVAYQRPRQKGVRIRSLAVVDGQQRTLTLYIFVMALVEVLAGISKERAYDVVRQFLLLVKYRGLDVNTTVVPAFDDRSQFRVLWDRLNSPRVLQEEFGEDIPQPPRPSGPASGPLTKQYSRILTYVKKVAKDEGESGVEELLDLITLKLTFVHLELHDPSAATKIFERLNFRGVRVGITDLVRNEVFGRVDDSANTQAIFDQYWHPFERSLEEHAEGFFFPYALVQDSSVTKSELFSQLRLSWNGLDAVEVIDHMRPFLGPFMSIQAGHAVEGSPALSAALGTLIRARRPSSCFPFVMEVLLGFKEDKISEAAALELLATLESFLVRRAMAGYEPTGLHALFKGLYGDLADPTMASFQGVVASKSTIQWPGDEEVRESIALRPLGKSKICGFLLTEYDHDLPGDDPALAPTIEHVLPQSWDKKSDWAADFTTEQHAELRDTLANLVPLSAPMNSSVQAGPYSAKRPRYQKESAFKTPRQFADDYKHWTPSEIHERAQKLGEWAVGRWPIGPT
jgi:hypothetical protein